MRGEKGRGRRGGGVRGEGEGGGGGGEGREGGEGGGRGEVWGEGGGGETGSALHSTWALSREELPCGPVTGPGRGTCLPRFGAASFSLASAPRAPRARPGQGEGRGSLAPLLRQLPGKLLGFAPCLLAWDSVTPSMIPGGGRSARPPLYRRGSGRSVGLRTLALVFGGAEDRALGAHSGRIHPGRGWPSPGGGHRRQRAQCRLARNGVFIGELTPPALQEGTEPEPAAPRFPHPCASWGGSVFPPTARCCPPGSAGR